VPQTLDPRSIQGLAATTANLLHHQPTIIARELRTTLVSRELILPLSPFVPLELLPFSTLEGAVITANPPLFLLEWTRFVTLTPKIFQYVPPLLP
jgi:hypothetical protein